MSITIGHDAEVFAQDSKGNVHSAIGLVGGTKMEPSKCDLGALQEDNVMAELNIVPATTAEQFIHNTNVVMGELHRRLKKFRLKPLIQPHAVFSEDELFAPQAQTFGCKPDYCAWDRCENPVVNLSESHNRYAGGHIHIGVPYVDDPVRILSLIRLLDVTVGCSLLAKYGISERTKTYGRWGAHRPTSYGVEYRMIDNSWLQDKAVMKWLFDVTYWAANMFTAGGLFGPAKQTIKKSVTKTTLTKAVEDNDIAYLSAVARYHLPEELRLV
jgi:hypothetical protein